MFEKFNLLEKVFRMIFDVRSGGCTSFNDMEYFNHINKENVTFWYAAEDEKCTYLIVCVSKDK